MKRNKQFEEIEIPFGAYDSELKGWEYTIPEGFTAEIEDGKIIIKQKESDDERIRKFLIDILSSGIWKPEWPFSPVDCVTYLEKQKAYSQFGEGLYYYNGEQFYAISPKKKQKRQKPTESAEDIYKEMEDARKEAEKPHLFQDPSYYTPPCFYGGMCTNPFRDCINCPRIGDMYISTTSGNYKKD